MIDESKDRRWWRHWWLVSLGACTAWPALASEGAAPIETSATVPVEEAAFDQPLLSAHGLGSGREVLHLARLPRRSTQQGQTTWVAQGASAGEGLALVLRWPEQPGRTRVLEVARADGAGRASWTLPSDRGLPTYSVELWSLGGPGGARSYWSGPLAQVVSNASGASGSTWDETRVPEQVGGMIVSEIMKDPSAVSDSNGEWIELYNPLWMRQDIEGWTLSDDGGSSTILTNGGAGIWVAGRGHRALVRRLDSATNGGVTEAYAYSGFTLSNGADEVILAHPDGTVVDRVAYDDGVRWPDTSGASLQLDRDVESPRENDSPSRWCEGLQVYGAGDLGTPGAANDDC